MTAAAAPTLTGYESYCFTFGVGVFEDSALECEAEDLLMLSSNYFDWRRYSDFSILQFGVI